MTLQEATTLLQIEKGTKAVLYPVFLASSRKHADECLNLSLSPEERTETAIRGHLMKTLPVVLDSLFASAHALINKKEDGKPENSQPRPNAPRRKPVRI